MYKNLDEVGERDIGAKLLAFIFSMSHFPFVVVSDT